MKRGATFPLCVVILMVSACSVARAQAEIEELARQLSVPPKEPYGLSEPQRTQALQAIHRLTELATPDAVAALKSFLTTPDGNRLLKQQALVALGKIGSQQAVDAIREFESWAEKRRANPPPFTFGFKDYPVDRFPPLELKPLVTWKSADGREQAVFRWHRFGQWFLYSTTRRNETEWEQPVLLEVPDMRELAGDGQYTARVEGDKVVLGWQGEFRFDAPRVAWDRDKDGIPDVIERLIGTVPFIPDSDGDGIPDGLDGNPLTSKNLKPDDPMEIRQAVFTVLFATYNNADAIFLVEDKDNPDFARQEYFGFPGYVLRAPSTHPGMVSVMDMTVKLDSAETAAASISTWQGMGTGSTREAKLKKLHGKWVIVDFRLTAME